MRFRRLARACRGQNLWAPPASRVGQGRVPNHVLRLGVELRQHACVVVQSPVLHDDSMSEAVKDHRPELDALASWSNSLELPLMRPLVPHVIRNPVVFCDKRLDCRVKVRERCPPRDNLHLRVFGQLATRLVDVSPDVRLIRLGLRRRHHSTKIMPGVGTGCNGRLTAHRSRPARPCSAFRSTLECASRRYHGNWSGPRRNDPKTFRRRPQRLRQSRSL
jgi:hypothetical protein